MHRRQLVDRIHIITGVFVVAALMMISRSLMIVLNYSYSITGVRSAYIALGLIMLLAHVSFLSVRFAHRVGPRAVVEFSAIKNEWRSYSTLTKLLAIAGLTNLPGGILTLWNLIEKMLHIFGN